MVCRANSAAAAALLLALSPCFTLSSARAFSPPGVELPMALRQSTSDVTYAQCDDTGRTHIASIMSTCGGCLNGDCPDSCCTEQPADNQWVICEVPEAGSTGCCIRVMGNGQVEVAVSETVTTIGKNDAGVCEPAQTGAESQCPAETCALAGAGGGEEQDCPDGVLVTPPNEVFTSPAQCASGSSADAGAEASTAAPASTAADTAVADAVATTAGTADAFAADSATTGGTPITIVGSIPDGCTNTFPGFRCMGEEGFPPIDYLGGCCVGECQQDPAKGWGYWCPELSGSAGDEGGANTATTAQPAETAATTTIAAASSEGAAGGFDAAAAGAAAAGAGAVAAAAAATGGSVTTVVPSSTDEASSNGQVGTNVAGTTAVDASFTDSAAPTDESEEDILDLEATPDEFSVGSVVTVAAATTDSDPVVTVSTTTSSTQSGDGSGNTTRSVEENGSSCFHGSGIVELENGASKTMFDLAVGDSVKVGPGMYSKVFMFSHKNAAEPSKFVKLSLSSGHEIIVTPGHYMWSDQGLVVSESVKEGDMLLLGDGGASPVTGITWMEDKGLYNPHTLQGDIVVNDIKASTFTRAITPKLARTMLAPLRAAFLTFGFSMKALESGSLASTLGDLLPKGPATVMI